MKPFNLEEAKAGKPVCTRDGRDVRIICFDKRDAQYPIVALLSEIGIEAVALYHQNGKTGNSDKDLFMKPEKKTGWINIYKSDNSLKDVFPTSFFI